MKLNTLIKLPDGRVGRTVYHNLDGYGIKFGTEIHDPENLPEPDAMLRKPWRDDHKHEMVGDDYERIDVDNAAAHRESGKADGCGFNPKKGD